MLLGGQCAGIGSEYSRRSSLLSARGVTMDISINDILLICGELAEKNARKTKCERPRNFLNPSRIAYHASTTVGSTTVLPSNYNGAHG